MFELLGFLMQLTMLQAAAPVLIAETTASIFFLGGLLLVALALLVTLGVICYFKRPKLHQVASVVIGILVLLCIPLGVWLLLCFAGFVYYIKPKKK